MPSTRRLRLAASGGVLLALAGVWLGHTLEYARVVGVDGLRGAMLGSLHLYMLPLGALIAMLAAAGAVRGVRAWQVLGRQLEAARMGLAGAWRGRAVPGETAARVRPPRPQSIGGRIATMASLLAPLQMGLYLLQENLEAHIAGAPMPGMGAVTGVHALAPVVHAAVALAFSALVVAASQLLRRRAAAVEQVVALLRAVLDRLAAFAAAVPRAGALSRPAPLDRFGRLWCRPPPLLLAV
ncbi:MAG TPA: hypothetical protein VGQ42_00610 [Candidatus Dormibacteraeota bacterium]|jgi:hypothetical protein|nr:hypothetical protein [Candidatus Dormibacteraeota bacterium]